MLHGPTESIRGSEVT